jgi:aryl-alcohol dehydrogenase-like predicted oxidoreductase
MSTNSSSEEFSSHASKQIFIGTANFNKKYGIGDRASMFDKRDLKKIFSEVELKHNVLLDTAQGYSDAEKLIGEIAGKKLENKVVTKISPNKHDTAESTVNLVKKSLIDLNQNCLYGVLLHDSNVIEYPNIDDIIQGLEYCIDSGIVSHIGISSYDSASIQRAAAKYRSLTIFQINENVIDQRNFNSKELNDLKQIGKQISVRSIFLQGNLLVKNSEIIPSLMPKREVFVAFEKFCEQHNSSPLKICLDYAKSIAWSNGIIVGVNNFENYLEIIENYSTPTSDIEFSNSTLGSFYSDPRNWINSLC